MPTFAQNNGNVTIHVRPKQAYVFVDGNAIRDGSQTISLSPGKHSIGVYNYGYMPEMRTVDIVAGQTINLNVALRETGDKVSGPFGDIELKGHPRAAVLAQWHELRRISSATWMSSITIGFGTSGCS